MSTADNVSAEERKAEEVLVRLVSLSRQMREALASRDTDAVAALAEKQEQALSEAQTALEHSGRGRFSRLAELVEELRRVNQVNAELLRDELETARFLMSVYSGGRAGVYTPDGQIGGSAGPLVVNTVG